MDAPKGKEDDIPKRRDEQEANGGSDENDIDRILADSFPASDAPPWTFGVAQAPTKEHRTRRKNR